MNRCRLCHRPFVGKAVDRCNRCEAIRVSQLRELMDGPPPPVHWELLENAPGPDRGDK